MVNKRGIWRVLEAVFAILIVVGGIFLFYPERIDSKDEKIIDKMDYVLDEIAKNASVRDLVLIDDDSSYDAENIILQLVFSQVNNQRIKYNVSICSFTKQDCTLGSDAGKNVYSVERVISANLTFFNPKLIKIYVWRE